MMIDDRSRTDVDPSLQARDLDRSNAQARKQWLLREAGGYLEEGTVGEWLGLSLAALRGATAAGRLLAVTVDDRKVYPAIQFRGGALLPGLSKILAAMPIKAGWMRLEWLLVPDTALGDQSPLEALRSGRFADVLACARAHGAD